MRVCLPPSLPDGFMVYLKLNRFPTSRPAPQPGRKKEDSAFVGSLSSGGEKMRRCAKLSKLPIYPISSAPSQSTHPYIFNFHPFHRRGFGKIFSGFIKIFPPRLRPPFLWGLVWGISGLDKLSQFLHRLLNLRRRLFQSGPAAQPHRPAKRQDRLLAL